MCSHEQKAEKVFVSLVIYVFKKRKEKNHCLQIFKFSSYLVSLYLSWFVYDVWAWNEEI